MNDGGSIGLLVRSGMETWGVCMDKGYHRGRSIGRSSHCVGYEELEVKYTVRLHIKPANSFAHVKETLRHILHRMRQFHSSYVSNQVEHLKVAHQRSIFPTATNSIAHSDESLENPLAAAPVDFAVATDAVTVLPPPPSVTVHDVNVVSKLSELPSPVVCANPPVGRLVNDEVAAPPISVAPPTVCVPPSPVQDSPMGQQPATPLSPMLQASSEGQ
jgi:hypothetical protein